MKKQKIAAKGGSSGNATMTDSRNKTDDLNLEAMTTSKTSKGSNADLDSKSVMSGTSAGNRVAKMSRAVELEEKEL